MRRKKKKEGTEARTASSRTNADYIPTEIMNGTMRDFSQTLSARESIC